MEAAPGTRQPFRTAMETFLNENEIKVYSKTTHELITTESEIDILLAGSIVLASHQDGFKGTTVTRFLSNLFFELGLISSSNHILKFPNSIENRMSLPFPFLSPVNQSWPKCFKELCDVNLEDFESRVSCASSRKKIEFKTKDGYLTGEFDFEYKEGATFAIPSHSRIHLIIREKWDLKHEIIAAFLEKDLEGRNLDIYVVDFLDGDGKKQARLIPVGDGKRLCEDEALPKLETLILLIPLHFV
jgi:hypothetical protein